MWGRGYSILFGLYTKGLHNVQTATEAYSGVKRPGREADLSIVARYRVLGAILPLLLYTIMVCMGTGYAGGFRPFVR